jgi:hypothetical protein
MPAVKKGNGRTSVMFSWEAPRFESTLGQRELRILNAIFLGVARAGGKGAGRWRGQA